MSIRSADAPHGSIQSVATPGRRQRGEAECCRDGWVSADIAATGENLDELRLRPVGRLDDVVDEAQVARSEAGVQCAGGGQRAGAVDLPQCRAAADIGADGALLGDPLGRGERHNRIRSIRRWNQCPVVLLQRGGLPDTRARPGDAYRGEEERAGTRTGLRQVGGDREVAATDLVPAGDRAPVNCPEPGRGERRGRVDDGPPSGGAVSPSPANLTTTRLRAIYRCTVTRWN